MAAAASLFVLLSVVGSIAVGLDARKNSSQSALLWALAVLLGSVPILLVYVLLGRDATDDPTPESASESDLVECPNCHAIEEPTASVCRFCDEPIRTPDGPERGSPGDDVESPG